MRTILFIMAILLGVAIGAIMLSTVFFGLLILAVFVGLIENTPVLKWIVYRCPTLVDGIVFFVSVSIIFTVKPCAISASFIIAGLGFIFLYRPYIKRLLTHHENDPETHHEY